MANSTATGCFGVSYSSFCFILVTLFCVIGAWTSVTAYEDVSSIGFLAACDFIVLTYMLFVFINRFSMHCLNACHRCNISAQPIKKYFLILEFLLSCILMLASVLAIQYCNGDSDMYIIDCSGRRYTSISFNIFSSITLLGGMIFHCREETISAEFTNLSDDLDDPIHNNQPVF